MYKTLNIIYFIFFALLVNLSEHAVANRRPLPLPQPPILYQCDCTLNQYYELWNSCTGIGTARWGTVGTDHNSYSTNCSSANWQQVEYPQNDNNVQCGVIRTHYTCTKGPPLGYDPPVLDIDPAHQRTCHGQAYFTSLLEPGLVSDLGNHSVYYLSQCSSHNTEFYTWYTDSSISEWFRYNFVWE